MVLFLYGKKYIAGKSIFILYTIVDMIKFANMSIVLSASGKTKTLMICSIASLGCNTVFNILFYRIFGFIGPAIATVLVTMILTVFLAEMSAKSLETSIWKLIEWKDFFCFVCELTVAGIICVCAKKLLEQIATNSAIILFILGGTYVVGILILNKHKITSTMNQLNKLH